MNQLQVPFSRAWEVRLPVVTRYLEQTYVDAFFDEGILRLSSFKRFRSSVDEERGDELEGRVTAEMSGPNIRHSVLAVNGQAAFILCGSLVENSRMQASFSTQAGIRIIHGLAFTDVVSRHIPGFVGGMQGSCIYREDTTLRKKTAQPFVPPASAEDMEAWAAKQDRFVADQTREGFFIKRLAYAHQNEYRFIWFARGTEEEVIFVKCPDAKAYCERA